MFRQPKGFVLAGTEPVPSPFAQQRDTGSVRSEDKKSFRRTFDGLPTKKDAPGSDQGLLKMDQ
jgi:hypothetical protein